MTEIRRMQTSLAEADILARVAAALPAHSTPPAIERRVYYPYFRYVVRGALRWLFGKRAIRVDCLIDARTGRAATADEFDIESVPADSAERLPARHSAGESRKSAERYTRHSLGRACRVLASFHLRADQGELVHRPYWIVRAAGHRLLVDGVTGELHPLPTN